MQYRPYGKTGISVSNLGFGAMRLPALENGQVDLEKSVPILRRGLDLGITYIDTAFGYINGTSEVAVGQAIKPYERSKLTVATKIPVGKAEDAQAAEYRRKLELCLSRLDSPYIDLILFHGMSLSAFTEWVSKPGGALEEARKAQSQGLVRHICFSSHDTTENIMRLIDTGEFAGMLVQYNYLDRHNEPAILHASQHGMGVTIMGPVAGGRLVLPNSLVVDSEGALEVKTPELALRFVWNNPGVSTAISGMNTIEMVEENAASAARLAQMDEKENAAIISLVDRNQKLSDLYCTGCSYCMPCPNEVNIPENFRYMNWYRVWGMEKEAQAAYAKLSKDGSWMPYGKVVGLNAEACLQCGECEPKCPQNIHIIDQLEEVAHTLKA